MTEIHTRIFCKCGHVFYHMQVGELPLSKHLEINVYCPECKNLNTVNYEFSATFTCLHDDNRKWWEKLIGKKKPLHYIKNHFTKNEGTTDVEIFPRTCNCGKTVLLNQRRVN